MDISIEKKFQKSILNGNQKIHDSSIPFLTDRPVFICHERHKFVSIYLRRKIKLSCIVLSMYSSLTREEKYFSSLGSFLFKIFSYKKISIPLLEAKLLYKFLSVYVCL